MTLLNTKIAKAASSLEALGLTRYEATCYTTLLALGESEAKEIREYSNIPLAKVYQTLNELRQRGFVTVLEKERPARYIAAEPKIILTLLEKERSEAQQRVTEALDDVVKSHLPKRTPSFWPFFGEDNLEGILRKIIPEAQNEIICSISSRILARIGIDFKALKENRILLRALVADNDDFHFYSKWGFTIRRLLEIPFIPSFFESLTSVWQFGGREQIGILIVDHTDSVILVPIFPTEQIGVWVMDSDVIAAGKRFLDFLWDWFQDS